MFNKNVDNKLDSKANQKTLKLEELRNKRDQSAL